ncbi:hypothetical protein BVRB_9g225140 [Beta vulgaris subsp. vulgaris]|uniref:Uncharacterized protein n=1 Tax=Beta vulgaris subsp. vulgaris TaxID=3555 RepID=A0A0J8B5E4_BETVV|nr:hypothetical protein BVRB_9g225140 [Beta vulgaris subsp. vulgaris]
MLLGLFFLDVVNFSPPLTSSSSPKEVKSLLRLRCTCTQSSGLPVKSASFKMCL